jgi:hypothetical protein
MQLIYLVTTLLLVLVNLAGLTALCSRFMPYYALARSGGVLLVCTAMFFVEHFVGLGKLSGLWPVSTLLALAELYRVWRLGGARRFLAAEAVFVAAVLYGLIWKWAFPDIYPSSERITDLYFIGNYIPGETLPPLDHWYPPHRFDFYYAFQHYAAALMGRIFGMVPGLACNIAFVITMALSISLAWDFASRWLGRGWKCWLVVASFVIGGTGASPFVHLAYQPKADLSAQEKVNVVNNRMWASQRFAGSIGQIQNTPFGARFFADDKAEGKEPLELPMENFGYQFYVGDYHPPLGGFLLLMLAIAAIGALESRPITLPAGVAPEITDSADFSARTAFLLQALLVFTVPLTIATNTWVFPLQALLVLAWLVWRWIEGNPPLWPAVFIGGGLGFLLLYPFLQGFTANAAPTPIKWVQGDFHTPPLEFFALHWPLLGFVLLSLFLYKGHHKGHRAALFFGMVFLALLMISEFIYVDDPTTGRYERTNSVMKWWGWIWSGALVSITTLLLAARVRWISGAVVAVLLAVNLYAVDIANYWIYSNISDGGKFTADSVYTREPAVKNMFSFLANAPDGIVLENNYGGSFTDSGVYAAFAAKPSLQGWPMHLLTWHTGLGQMWILNKEIIAFYKGELADADTWLLANHVSYVVWNAKDAGQTDAWDDIDAVIHNDYGWLEFGSDASRHVGLWVRRPWAL